MSLGLLQEVGDPGGGGASNEVTKESGWGLGHGLIRTSRCCCPPPQFPSSQCSLPPADHSRWPGPLSGRIGNGIWDMESGIWDENGIWDMESGI